MPPNFGELLDSSTLGSPAAEHISLQASAAWLLGQEAVSASLLTGELPALPKSPARFLHERADLPPHVVHMLQVWPYRVMPNPTSGGALSSVEELAASSAQPIQQTITHLLDLENAGLLTWDASEGRYLMTSP